MTTSLEENKALVLEAFDTLFNKRDYAKAAEFWSENYIQHSAHIEPGRDGLFNLIRSLPDTLRYENAHIMAEGDYVMLHGRFSGHGRPRSWIAADIVRMEGRAAGRALGCFAGRSNQGGIEKWPADVWHFIRRTGLSTDTCGRIHTIDDRGSANDRGAAV